MSIAERYALDVLEGKIVAGKFIKNACRRFINDLQRKDIFFDEEEASKVIVFAERYCRLWEDVWQGLPVKVEPWMAFVLQQIYGWFKHPVIEITSKDSGGQKEYLIKTDWVAEHREHLALTPKEDQLSYDRFYITKCKRRVRKVFVEVAKKNAKSTLASVLSLYHLFADERVNTPKVFVGANNEQQAKICVNIAGKIIGFSPELSEYLQDKTVTLHNYGEDIIRVVHHERHGFIKPMSKEAGDKNSKQAGGKHGVNPSLWIIDEYGLAESDALLNTFETAQAARYEPLGFAITTAGHNKSGPCFTKLRKAGIDVNDGTFDSDTFLAFIYEMDEEDDINDEANWIKCNPSLGVTVTKETLRILLNDAVRDGGSQLVDVTTFNFNRWCDAPKVWITSDVWNGNSYGLHKYDALKGRVCYGGVDLGRTSDLNAFALWFPRIIEPNSQEYAGPTVKPEPIHAIRLLCWIPEARVDANKDNVDYRKWAADGWIKITKGNVADYETISADIIEAVKDYDFKSLAYDKRFFVGNVLNPLQAAGLTCHELAQDIRTLNGPTKEFERLSNGKFLEHFNNPMLAWMIGNTETARDTSGNIKPDKSADHRKIDGVSATINSLAEFKTFEHQVMTIGIL